MTQKIMLISFLFGKNIGGGAVKVVDDIARFFSEYKEIIVVTTHSGFKTVKCIEDNMIIYQLGLSNLYWVADKDNQPVWKKIIWQLIDIWNPIVFIQMYKILKMEKPDVIHVHKLRGLSPSVWTAAKAAKIPKIIHTSHDYELISPQGTLSGRVGQWVEENRWYLRPYSWSRSLFSKAVDVATAPSRYTLDKIRIQGFFSNAETRVIPNTHGFTKTELDNISDRTSTAPNKDDNIFRILYLGRLAPNKGVDVLCDAFVALYSRHSNIHLDIAGFGELEADMRNKYGKCLGITFHGGVFGETKETLLSQCDVLVLPSTWQEVFGIVIIEAYAFGKPVIATRVGGVPELIEEGKTGFLITPGNPDALVEVLEKLCVAPKQLQEMTEYCLKMAHKYTVDNILNQYDNLY